MKKFLFAMTLVTAAASASAADPAAKLGTTTATYKSVTNSTALTTAMINTAFTGTSWNALVTGGTTTSTASGTYTLGDISLAWTLAKPTGANNSTGTFSFTANKAVTFDLALGLNYDKSKTTSEWFFDDIKLTAEKTSGTFVLSSPEFNKNGVLQGVTTMGLYARDVKATVSPVPEPESYAMMLGALGLLTVVARRKRS